MSPGPEVIDLFFMLNSLGRMLAFYHFCDACDTYGSCLCWGHHRRPRCHTFGSDRLLLKGYINFIQTLQKGKISLNTGQNGGVRKFLTELWPFL